MILIETQKTAVPMANTHRGAAHERFLSNLAACLPLMTLPVTVLLLREALPAWVFMWAIAFALFFGCKWLTWWPERNTQGAVWRHWAYLFAWPGLDARGFLGVNHHPAKPSTASWLAAIRNTILGALLLWGLTPTISSAPVIQAWAGMVGVILILHFGTFNLLALFWQTRGINAAPLMQQPSRAVSLAEFWGRRWNSAFSQIAHQFLFRRMHRRLGASAATMTVFLASGLVHELVISLPAEGGYGLPTAYFALQGAGLLFERSRMGRRLGLGRGWRGRLFVWVLTAMPAYWLFHPAFIRNVILPMLHAIGAT